MNRTTSKIISASLIVFTLGVGETLAQATRAQQEAYQPDVFRLCGSDFPTLVESSHACAATNPGRARPVIR